jgi:hypothetical protein
MISVNKQKLVIFLLAFFLLGDLAYSFLEYYYVPLDGDISAGVVPSTYVQLLLDDPFGFHLLSTGEKHVNPNRFFAHYFFREYMLKVPKMLQNLTDPLSSVYLSCAVIKLLIHLLVIFILASLISGTKKIFNKKILICAALIVPFIQANGYWGHLGINDRATTYTFFYALPVVLLMLFLMPFYRMIFQNEGFKIGIFKSVWMFAFVFILPLSGPLNPAIILIVTGLIGINYFVRYGREEHAFSIDNMFAVFRKIPTPVYVFLIPICMVSLYSLFLGRFDINYSGETIPVIDRYLKLPMGVYYQISQSLGVPLLLIIIGINVYLINRHFYSVEGRRIVNVLKWIGVFAAVYLILLPLGGYRPYRPNILRYDTFMPIAIALIYFFGLSTIYLLANLKLKKRNIYLIGLFAFFAVYMNADRLEKDEYTCERRALEYLVNSPDSITLLPFNCNVMSWDTFTDPRRSEYNAIMLKNWGVTYEKKLYYQTMGQK